MMVDQYLQASFSGDKSAREQMHYAQCLAGMAFSNALLGITHSLAHKTGPAYSTGHIPHGCANAIYLPFVIRFNAKDETTAARYALIARHIGLKGDSDAALVEALCAKIDQYNSALNIPHTLQEFGIVEAEFLQKLDHVAELAVGDACTLANPRKITPPDSVCRITRSYPAPILPGNWAGISPIVHPVDRAPRHLVAHVERPAHSVTASMARQQAGVVAQGAPAGLSPGLALYIYMSMSAKQQVDAVRHPVRAQPAGDLAYRDARACGLNGKPVVQLGSGNRCDIVATRQAELE